MYIILRLIDGTMSTYLQCAKIMTTYAITQHMYGISSVNEKTKGGHDPLSVYHLNNF